MSTIAPTKKSQVPWSDLLPEIWIRIGKRLDTHIDVARFRSVCRSWRAFLPPSNTVSVLSPVAVTYPLVTVDRQLLDVSVIQRTIYGVKPLHHHLQSSNDKLRLLRPVCEYSKLMNQSLLKTLNFLDFRIHEVAKSYLLAFSYAEGVIVAIKNVKIFPDSAWVDVKNYTIIILLQNGKLGLIKYGDPKWTLIPAHNNVHHDDVIVFKGKCYAIDTQGRVLLIDSSMTNLVEFSPPLLGVSGNQKKFVKCGDELYFVDRFLEHLAGAAFHDVPVAVDFKVYRLDQKRRIWLEVNNLGDQSFLMNHDCCFSISAPDFEGYKGSCIYYTDDVNFLYNSINCEFDLQKRTILEVPQQNFEPPPAWLDSEATVLESVLDHEQIKQGLFGKRNNCDAESEASRFDSVLLL